MRILVTAGPTREPIDAVRFISNRSSGKMGYALASEAAERGHQVVLISGPVSLPTPNVMRVKHVETAAEMLCAVQEELPACRALIMSAAVADWRPSQPVAEKLKKRCMADSLSLERTADILATVVDLKEDRIYVGFAAETGELLQEAQRKLEEKHLDLIVANDVSRSDSGFGTDTNQAVIISADGHRTDLPLMSKAALAAHILAWIESAADVA